MKPILNAQQEEKNTRRQKKSENGGEERTRKVKVKTAVSLLNLEILLSAHAWTSQADILHLDQKGAKYDL